MSEKDFDEDLGEPSEPEESTPPPPKPKISSKTPAGAKPASKISSKTPAKKGYGSDDISVFFESTIGPGSKKQKLLVNTKNEVSAIKSTVGKMFGLDPDDFHLTYGGVTLEESDPLKNYDVHDGDTILLIPASTAGLK
jgi:hypothetical protein